MIEREKFGLPRMPLNAQEQIENVIKLDKLDSTYRERMSKNLERGTIFMLSSFGIEIIEASHPPKTIESMLKKAELKRSIDFMRDINRMRLVINIPYPNRAFLAEKIQAAYPLTPKFFADGFPTVRDYADPNMRKFIQEKFNPNISDKHSALHINIIFEREDSNIYEIAEVQILTQKEMKLYNQTRFLYKNGHVI